MPGPENDYQDLAFRERVGVTAGRAWLALLFVFAAWCILIVAPAVLAGTSLDGISQSLYSFFGYICHQHPERSFFIFDHQLGVCSRCIGVYFGLVLGVAGYPLFRQISEVEPISRIWLILSMIPIGVDWSLTFFGFWENTFLTRFVTGLILANRLLGFPCTGGKRVFSPLPPAKQASGKKRLILKTAPA